MSTVLTIMGCGNSEGVPAIGNQWGDCDQNEPKNRRTRPSVAVQSDATTLIIDTGPDFKHQINTHQIDQIDAVLYTHAHADHVSGIDELRGWAKRIKSPIDIYSLSETLYDIQSRFDYHFIQKHPLYPAVLTPHEIKETALCATMSIGDISFIPFEQDHGMCKSMGFRFGDVAYSTDLIGLSDQSIAALQGIKTWIIDGAGYNWPENPAHLSLEGVYALNQEVGAQNVYLTHMSRYMDYKTLINELPQGYAPAYDGLMFSL